MVSSLSLSLSLSLYPPSIRICWRSSRKKKKKERKPISSVAVVGRPAPVNFHGRRRRRRRRRRREERGGRKDVVRTTHWRMCRPAVDGWGEGRGEGQGREIRSPDCRSTETFRRRLRRSVSLAGRFFFISSSWRRWSGLNISRWVPRISYLR